MAIIKKLLINIKINKETALKASFYIAIIISVIAQIFAVIFFAPKLRQAIIANSAKINELEKDNKSFLSSEEKLAQINITQLNDDLKKVTAALPNEKKISGLVTGVINIASQSGITVTAIEFSPGNIASRSASEVSMPIGKNLKAIPTNLSINSDLDSIGKFLKQLDTVSQITGIKGISFGVVTGSRYGTSFPLQVYYQLPNDTEIDFRYIELLTAEEENEIKNLSNRDIFVTPLF